MIKNIKAMISSHKSIFTALTPEGLTADSDAVGLWVRPEILLFSETSGDAVAVNPKATL